MEPLYQVVYLSQASSDLTYTDLENILATSRRNNEVLGISGILIYKDDQFIQLLEGHQQNVVAVMERIMHDNRNQDVRVLYEGSAEERLFADWSMAYADGELSKNDNLACRRLFQMASQYQPEMKEFIVLTLKEFRDSKPHLL